MALIFLAFEIKERAVQFAIVKRIMEHHKGKLWIENVLREGSVFDITLPDRG